MGRLFLTYAWRDNEDSTVDLLTQELEKEKIVVLRDRWVIGAGQRLWERIEKSICDPATTAWGLFATPSSLQSQPCREELAIALDRALSARGDSFPLIGIFPAVVSREMIPSAIRVRRYVLTSEPNWRSTVAAATRGEDAAREPILVSPFEYKLHSQPSGQLVLEIRPRLDTWFPAFAAVAFDESQTHGISVCTGGPGHPPSAAITMLSESEQVAADGARLKVFVLNHQINPACSMYISMREKPSFILFGPAKGDQYRLSF